MRNPSSGALTARSPDFNSGGGAAADAPDGAPTRRPSAIALRLMLSSGDLTAQVDLDSIHRLRQQQQKRKRQQQEQQQKEHFQQQQPPSCSEPSMPPPQQPCSTSSCGNNDSSNCGGGNSSCKQQQQLSASGGGGGGGGAKRRRPNPQTPEPTAAETGVRLPGAAFSGSTSVDLSSDGSGTSVAVPAVVAAAAGGLTAAAAAAGGLLAGAGAAPRPVAAGIAGERASWQRVSAAAPEAEDPCRQVDWRQQQQQQPQAVLGLAAAAQAEDLCRQSQQQQQQEGQRQRDDTAAEATESAADAFSEPQLGAELGGELGGELGAEPEPPFLGCARLIHPQQWGQFKVAHRQWRRQAEHQRWAEPAAAAALPPPPPLLLAPAAQSQAAQLLHEQQQALAAVQGRRASSRRAAAAKGAAQLAATQQQQQQRQEDGLEEVHANMAALRFSAPFLKQHRSPTHGWGLFAGAPIRRGAFVIEYVGEVVNNVVADRREKQYEASGGSTMYLFRLDCKRVIDATHKGNAARYINHSCNPNCFTRVLTDVYTGQRCMGIFALRDIEEGEELTYHYMIEEEPEGDPLPCNCGAHNCTGRMN